MNDPESILNVIYYHHTEFDYQKDKKEEKMKKNETYLDKILNDY
mgnify:CR=1 FL=1|jgi:hypothetical protein